jgi:low temperature requirement protein LtrA
VSYVIYNDRFGTDDVSDRVLTLLQMGAIVVAVRVHDAFGEGARAFALAFGAFRLLLAFRYLFAAYHVPAVRNFAELEAAGFGIAAVILIISARTPSPERYYLWGIALLIDMLTPFLVHGFHVAVPPDGNHVVERFGLFVLIVLGECFIGIVEGLRAIRWTPAAGMAAAFALCVGFSIWWVYFEALDVAPVVEIARSKRTGPYKLWLFAHFPLAAAIAASGIAVGQAVHEAPSPELPDTQRLLLVGGVATCLASLAVLHLTYAWVGGGRRSRHLAMRKMWAALAVLACGPLGRGATSVEVLGWLAIVCVVLVILELRDQLRGVQLMDVREAEQRVANGAPEAPQGDAVGGTLGAGARSTECRERAETAARGGSALSAVHPPVSCIPLALTTRLLGYRPIFLPCRSASTPSRRPPPTRHRHDDGSRAAAARPDGGDRARRPGRARRIRRG